MITQSLTYALGPIMSGLGAMAGMAALVGSAASNITVHFSEELQRGGISEQLALPYFGNLSASISNEVALEILNKVSKGTDVHDLDLESISREVMRNMNVEALILELKERTNVISKNSTGN